MSIDIYIIYEYDSSNCLFLLSQGSMSSNDSALVYLAYMGFKDLGLSEHFGSNAGFAGDNKMSGPLTSHLQALACRRRAETGHMLLSMLGDRTLDDCLAQYDAHRPEGKAALNKLVNDLYGKASSPLALENSAIVVAEVGIGKCGLEWDDLFETDLGESSLWLMVSVLVMVQNCGFRSTLKV